MVCRRFPHPAPRTSMPLIAQAALVYAAGLLTGFGGAVVREPALLVFGGIGAGALLLRRDARVVALAAVGAAAVLGARAAAAREAACRTHLAGARVWRVTLDVAAAPGAFVQGTAGDAGCAARASVAVERGSARAGEEVLAFGDG